MFKRCLSPLTLVNQVALIVLLSSGTRSRHAGAGGESA
ncbi:hypothetical protein, partial [Enterobacter hormaechei]